MLFRSRKMDNVESMKRAFRDTIKNAIDNQTTKIIKVRCIIFDFKDEYNNLKFYDFIRKKAINKDIAYLNSYINKIEDNVRELKKYSRSI